MTFARVGALSALVATSAAPQLASASEWSGSAELGYARTVSSDALFDNTWRLGLAGHRRWRDRHYPGVFVEYQSVIDAEPATSFWFAGMGLRFLSVFGRFCGRVEVGWALRHIALDQEAVSNTVGGPLLGIAAGFVAAKTRRGTFDLIVTSRATRAFPYEQTWVTDIGLAVVWRFPS